MTDRCCSPAASAANLPVRLAGSARSGHGHTAHNAGYAGEPAARARDKQRTSAIPGGCYRIGGADADMNIADGEGPVHAVRLSPFRMDCYAVSNARFAAFVADTGYVTEAERTAWSYVFGGFLTAAQRANAASPPGAPWWSAIADANWRSPEGPGSSIDGREQHPVVHVSWHDAVAYCRWADTSLPTEAQWEIAARGGLDQARYPWGNDLLADGRYHCNIWQGTFPDHNTADDGYAGTAPVDAFEPNGYGLYGMVGNVWEWTASRWSATWHAEAAAVIQFDPAGPATGAERSIRGGSYLCHDSYCNRYRVAARSHNTPDSTTGNLGFRTAAPEPADPR